jgi:ubiquinone/menaquinone biosynthesis C-methylase UbiE
METSSKTEDNEVHKAIRDENDFNQIFAPSITTKIRSKRRVDAIIGSIQHPLPKRILEIGCGMGDMSAQMALRFPRTEHYALDTSEKFIEEARKKHSHLSENLKFLDATNFRHRQTINFLSELGGFDVIFGNGILHHMVNDLDGALLDMRLLLRRGATLWNLMCKILIVSYFKNPIFRKKKLDPEEMAFSKSFIIDKLAMAGWHDVRVQTRDFLIPNTPKALIAPVIQLGDILEKIPLVNKMAQSLFIAKKINQLSAFSFQLSTFNFQLQLTFNQLSTNLDICRLYIYESSSRAVTIKDYSKFS